MDTNLPTTQIVNPIRVTKTMNVEIVELTLEETCSACPEQYWALMGKERVGYLRLRHGQFRAEYMGTVVYATKTIGDGCFDESERDFHLTKAKEAIHQALIQDHQGKFNHVRNGLTSYND